jgi:hypothetical protein
MEPPKDDQLIADLRALRPTPRPQFTAELDERAAAGFPRRSRLPRVSFSLPRVSPRQLLLPAGGLAVIAIAITTAVVAFQEDGNNERDGLLSMSSGARESVPSDQPHRLNEFSGPEVEAAEPPSAETQKHQRAMGASGAASVPNLDGNFSVNRNTVSNPRNRAVERSAQLVLAAEPADVGEDAAAVFEVVRAHDGIVMRSSTRQGRPGEAGARFELLIPSARLGEAMADLSAIDQVRTRREATADITARIVSLGELLLDSGARIDSLLGQLQEAETESEREAVEAELRQERRHRAALRSRLQQLERRAHFSRVSVRIVTGDENSSSGGVWGIGDALDDAGHILTIAAAVILVGLAVLGPIALIAFLAWLTHRAWVRRERRRVLG